MSRPVSRRRAMTLAVAAALPLAALAATDDARAQNAAVSVSVDAAAGQKSIDPRIYGIAHASGTVLADLNVPLNRSGGNNTSRYNWQQNSDNRGNDWYFQSVPYPGLNPGDEIASFVTATRGVGAEAMVTIPMVGWVAKLGPNRTKLASYSIAKYGAQTGRDWQWMPDAGNGVSAATNQPLTGNDPNDANIPADHNFQRGFVDNLVGRFGAVPLAAPAGQRRYYLYDNEHSIWHSTHRDVHPVGATMQQVRDKMVAYGTMLRAADPHAVLVGPEEWGWSGFLYSGYDQQYAPKNNWTFPDRAANGGMDYLPWLLDQMRQHQARTGVRLLDIFSVHYYPQGGEFSNDTSSAMQLRRNRSTRSLWDPAYTDESWIGTQVRLIPRLKGWVAQYHPGLQTGLTEYNWGAEGHINGATAQADILGIFGREGLDVAARWTTPDPATPTYKAIKLYRNYDGQKRGFGETSVAAVSSANPDNLSTFAAVRASDGALTVMAVNKTLSGATPFSVNLANFASSGPVQVYQLTSANVITRVADVAVTGNAFGASLPAQSVTLFVVPKGSGPVTPPPPPPPPPPADPTFTSSATPSPATLAAGSNTAISFTVAVTSGSVTNGIADLEVYDAAGNKVYQKFVTGVSLAAGQRQTFSRAWRTTTPGVFTVKVGVFSGDWSKNYHWNNGAATITVR